jgi:hypothetical protein
MEAVAVKLEQTPAPRQEQSLEQWAVQQAVTYMRLERESEKEAFETEKRVKTRRREQVEVLKLVRSRLGPEGFGKWIAANGISRSTAYRQVQEEGNPEKGTKRRAKNRDRMTAIRKPSPTQGVCETEAAPGESNQGDTNVFADVQQEPADAGMATTNPLDQIEMEIHTHVPHVKRLLSEVEARRIAIGKLMLRAKRALGDSEFNRWLDHHGWSRISAKECMTLAGKETTHAAA